MMSIYEFRLHGRGGQGAVVASKILAGAYFRKGYFVQAFPAFGMERRGAPVAAYVRADKSPILERGEVTRPTTVIVLDPVLLGMIDVTRGLLPKGRILLNHPLAPDELKWGRDFTMATVNASEIAVKHGIGSSLAPIVNTIILGALARFEPDLDLDIILPAIKAGAPSRPEANISAAREAYESLRIG